MFSLQFLKAPTRAGRTAGKGSRNRPWRRCLRHEPLEDRALLSLSAGIGPGEFVPGEILIGFEGEVPAAYAARGAAAALEAAGKFVGADGLHSPRVLMDAPATANRAARLATHWQLPAGADVLDVVAQLSGLPGIAYAEPNYVVSTDALPDDPKSDQLWGMDNTGQTGGVADADIDAPQAWDINTGSGNMVVGVIDTGVNYNHEDLAANIWTNPGEIPGNATTIWIDDVSQLEGDAATGDFVFTVSRVGDTSADSTVWTVDWTTAHGTATAASGDYVAASGRLTFSAGVTQQTITIAVNGDATDEAHETFLVELTNLSNNQGDTTPALIIDAQGLGTILNDHTTVSISDATVTEDDNRVVFLDDFVPAGRAGLDYPYAMDFGPDGDFDGVPDQLIVASWISAPAILRYDTRTGGGGEVFVAKGSGGMNAPNHLLFGPDGHLYVVNRIGGSGPGHDVLRFDRNTGVPFPVPGKERATFVTSGSGGLIDANALAFGPDENLYVAGHNKVIRYQGPSGGSPGAFIDVFTTDGGSGGAFRPRHLTFGPDGNLYVTESGRVLRYDGATGALIDEFVPTGGNLRFADGDLFVTSSTNEVLRYDGTTGVGTILDDEPPPPPPGVTVNPMSRLVTSEDLTSDTFTVVLDAQPTADVTIGISSDDLSEGTVSVASLTFTSANWNVAQLVTVTGVNDGLEDGDIGYTIVTAAAVSTDSNYNGLDPADVVVTNLDNEAPTGGSDDIYVWDIQFDTRTRGKGGSKHDERIVLTSDSISDLPDGTYTALVT